MTTTVLRIDSSARHEASVSRDLTDTYIETLKQAGDVKVITRDVSVGLPVVTEDWTSGAYTPEDKRTSAQSGALAISDALIEELQGADVIVIGMPVYNFSVPASLKLWIDQVCRANVTFKYTDKGPVGLLEGKRAAILMASGGTEAGSEIDFASTYLKHVLGFIGIHDVELFAADQLGQADGDKVARVSKRIKAEAA